MRLSVRMEDFPSVAFLVPKKNTSDTRLVQFHLLLPMGYIDSAPYFCIVTETVTNLANESITLRNQAGEHPLELTAEAIAVDNDGAPTAKVDDSWESLPAKQRSAATANVNVYLDEFISIFQGGPRER